MDTMNTTKYQFNYSNFLALTSTVIFFGIISRSIAKAPAAFIEYIMIFILLFFAILYILQSMREQNDRAMIVYIFLLYLTLHILVSVLFRPLEIDATLYEIFFFNLSEFRVSTLGYFLPLLFLPLATNESKQIKHVLIILLKISILYTLFEQILSILGYRTLFETFYSEAGLVGDHQIDHKSFGMYRVWGFTGSPQLLGIFHIYALVIMYINKDRFWSIMSFFGIIASTSKSAYMILVFLAILYLIYNKHYLTIIFLLLIFLGTIFQVNEFYNYLKYEEIQDYNAFQRIVESVKGYFILIDNTIVMDTEYIIRNGKTIARDMNLYVADGPFSSFYNYFMNNPIEIIFGKGITYSFLEKDLLPQPFIPYMATGSDFYILMFLEQYGFVGFISLTLMFFIYPMYVLFKEGNYHSFNLIVFYLATLHYPPNVPKMMMLIVAYSIYVIYFTNNKTQNE
tara:strand:- start:1113 stop:2474 length:1362 start_codon:yes stop_codon:yes gene_type:complete